MKLSYLLPLAITLLTACGEYSKETPTPTAPAPVETKNQESIQEGSSGLVIVQLAGLETTNPKLPPQISVTIEKVRSEKNNLELISYPDHLMPVLFSKSANTVSYGCNQQSKDVALPSEVDAQLVFLCGKIKVPAADFRLRASQLVLQDVELVTIHNDPKSEELGKTNLLYLEVASMVVHGNSFLSLEGRTQENTRDRSPSLSLHIGKVYGPGHFNIISRKSLRSLR